MGDLGQLQDANVNLSLWRSLIAQKMLLSWRVETKKNLGKRMQAWAGKGQKLQFHWMMTEFSSRVSLDHQSSHPKVFFSPTSFRWYVSMLFGGLCFTEECHLFGGWSHGCFGVQIPGAAKINGWNSTNKIGWFGSILWMFLSFSCWGCIIFRWTSFFFAFFFGGNFCGPARWFHLSAP